MSIVNNIATCIHFDYFQLTNNGNIIPNDILGKSRFIKMSCKISLAMTIT